jgi:uroporphyrinogen-III synthase
VTLRVAITRSPPDNELTAERVRALGGEPVLVPLLHPIQVLGDRDITGVQALIFTSANGVRAFANFSPYRDRPVYAVGETTAAWARAAGFQDVQSADGDGKALLELVKASVDPKGGRVLHISGEHIASDVVAGLSEAGFDAERRIGYRTLTQAQFEEVPPELLQPLDVVLFHSARAAETFVALGAPNADKLTAACISDAVAQAAGKARWARIIVSPAPRDDALLRAALAPNSPAGAGA